MQKTADRIFLDTNTDLQFHEFCDLLPDMSDIDFGKLKESIQKNGFDANQPIILFDGKILDGKHRYKACLELGIEPVFVNFDGDRESALDKIIALNIARRHLDQSQKAALSVKLAEEIAKINRQKQITAGQSGSVYGQLGGRGITKDSEKYREKKDDLIEQKNNETEKPLVPKLEQGVLDNDFSIVTEFNKPNNRTIEQVAQKIGVGKQYVNDALQIYKKAPEVLDAVKQGNLKIPQAKAIADLPEDEREEIITLPKSELVKKAKEILKEKNQQKQQQIEQRKQEYIESLQKDIADNPPVIYITDCFDFLPTLDDKSFDLLFTDPPYSTDIDDIEPFARKWLLLALSKVKDTGRAFIFIGAYPREVKAYLDILLAQDRFIVDSPLIWTYKNTLGQTPKMKYNLNYQIILHLYTNQSRELDTSVTGEMFSVQEFNAPDGRLGNRFHTWQKPIDLAQRLIIHSTQVGDKILDPFACTGTFLIAAHKLDRNAIGCEIDIEHAKIAESLGCKIVSK